MKHALTQILETIARHHDIAAVLVPTHIAMGLVDEMYPLSTDCDVARTNEARQRYLQLVQLGGYIGRVSETPMVVARDVVICSLNDQDLTCAATRLGINMQELNLKL